jgi:hypothetical protein
LFLKEIIKKRQEEERPIEERKGKTPRLRVLRTARASYYVDSELVMFLAKQLL